MNQYTKYGEGFYILDGPRHFKGHTTPAGNPLACPGQPCLAFKREGDPIGLNLDPADVLGVLVDHLEGTPAGVQLAAALETLVSAPVDPSPEPTKRKAGRPKSEPVAA